MKQQKPPDQNQAALFCPEAIPPYRTLSKEFLPEVATLSAFRLPRVASLNLTVSGLFNSLFAIVDDGCNTPVMLWSARYPWSPSGWDSSPPAALPSSAGLLKLFRYLQ